MTASESPRRAVEVSSRLGEAPTLAPEDVHAVASKPVREAQAPGSPPSPGPKPQIWVIELPSGMTLLNANQRLHWSAKAAATRELRKAAFYLARAAKIPHFERARIDCTYFPPRRGRRDAGNWSDTAKPCVDGVVDAGVLTDDSSAYLEGPFMHIGEVRPGGAFCLIITEIPEENSHV